MSDKPRFSVLAFIFGKDRAAQLANVLILAGVFLVLFGHDCAGSAALGGAIGVAINYSEQG